jgi:heterotetrameric sarcosine oxidase delta subunit
MSFWLTCPNCGPREVTEFRYGGQIVPVAVEGADKCISNLPGPQRERWYHRFGCRRWIMAERNVCTDEVLRTSWLSERAP